MSLGIINFIKTLLPHIEKDNVLEDLRMAETALQSIVRPAYSDASKFFSKDKFKSSANKAIDSQVRRVLKTTNLGRFPTFLGEYHARLDLLEGNIGLLIKAVDTEIARDIVTGAVSTKRIVLLRMAEKMSFITTASLNVLNLVYQNEQIEAGADKRETMMSPAEVVAAKSQIDNLSKLLENYGIPKEAFEKLLATTPDLMIVKDDTADIEGMYTDSQLDPVNPSNLIGFGGSPIYKIRMVIAEYQTRNFNASQEKKKVLELRLLWLQQARDKAGTNPKLEKEIGYVQDRINKLDRELSKFQEDLDEAA